MATIRVHLLPVLNVLWLLLLPKFIILGEMDVIEQEKRNLEIHIHLTRGLVVVLTAVLLVLAFIAYMEWSREPAAAQSPQEFQVETSAATSRRQYYRTWDSYSPTHIYEACAAGYHFASLWEILDPSNLEYNNTLGWNELDSGAGPPTERYGWIRTGYNSASQTGVDGQDNCSAWTSDAVADRGTQASLSWQWGVKEEIGVWHMEWGSCSIRYPVWCVED